MSKDPRKRLGNGRTGIQEIKQHPFFESIDWDDLSAQLVEPPFKPTVGSDLDTKYVDKEFLKQSRKDKKEF